MSVDRNLGLCQYEHMIWLYIQVLCRQESLYDHCFNDFIYSFLIQTQLKVNKFAHINARRQIGDTTPKLVILKGYLKTRRLPPAPSCRSCPVSWGGAVWWVRGWRPTACPDGASSKWGAWGHEWFAVTPAWKWWWNWVGRLEQQILSIQRWSR